MSKVHRTDGRRHDKEHVAVEVMTEIEEAPRRVQPVRQRAPSAEAQVYGVLTDAGFQRFELCVADEDTVLVAIPEGALLRARVATIADLLRGAHYEIEQVSDGVLLVSLPGTSAITVAEVAA